MVLVKVQVSTGPEKLEVLFLQSLCCTNHPCNPMEKPICQGVDTMLRNLKGLDWKGVLTMGHAIPMSVLAGP